LIQTIIVSEKTNEFAPAKFGKIFFKSLFLQTEKLI